MRIKKVSKTTQTGAQIIDGYSNSQVSGYSCNYINNSIIEKGNNAKGEYIKFANGVLINTKRVTITPTISQWYGNIGYCDVQNIGDWACPFVELWSCQVTCMTNQYWASMKDTSLAGAGSVRLIRPNDVVQGQQCVCHIFAIGRWK